VLVLDGFRSLTDRSPSLHTRLDSITTVLWSSQPARARIGLPAASVTVCRVSRSTQMTERLEEPIATVTAKEDYSFGPPSARVAPR
jgi:hypothetical protein